MKTILSTTVTALLAAVIFLSCDKHEPNEFISDKAVLFSTNIASQTRAANDAWSANDEIGIFMVNSGLTTVIDNAVNKKYVTTAGDGNFSASGDDLIYYPEDGSNVDFIAYYPYRSTISSLGIYEVDVADQSDQEDIDLLYTKATNEGAGYDKDYLSVVSLEFRHQLSKLILNINASGEGVNLSAEDLDNMTVVVTGFNTTADFDLEDATLSNKANPAPITLNKVTPGAVYDAIILPDEITTGNVTVTFTAGGRTFIWTPRSRTFESGKSYPYSVTLLSDGTATAMETSGTIIDWEPEPEPEPESGITTVFTAKRTPTAIEPEDPEDDPIYKILTETIDTEPGDYVFVYVHNNQSVYPTTTVETYTQITQSQDGTRRGALHYQVATGTSTELGEWTNTNGLAVIVLRGVKNKPITAFAGHSGSGVSIKDRIAFPIHAGNFDLGDTGHYILAFASSASRSITDYNSDSLNPLLDTEGTNWLWAGITKKAYTQANKPLVPEGISLYNNPVPVEGDDLYERADIPWVSFSNTFPTTIRMVVGLEAENPAP